MLEIAVRLVETSEVDKPNDTRDFNYVFVQQAYSSLVPWLPNMIIVRSKKELDFKLDKEYLVRIEGR